MTSDEYDDMATAIAEDAPKRQWVPARNLEAALAFQYWCVKNGFEKPEVRTVARENKP